VAETSLHAGENFSDAKGARRAGQGRLIGSLGLPSLNVPQAAPPSAALYAETAAPNEIQFNGVGELRSYIKCVRIDDQPSR
jgi:hypothetical protein